MEEMLSEILAAINENNEVMQKILGVLEDIQSNVSSIDLSVT